MKIVRCAKCDHYVDGICECDKYDSASRVPPEHFCGFAEKDGIKVELVPDCEYCQSYDNGYCHTLKVRMDPCDFCSYGKDGNNG